MAILRDLVITTGACLVIGYACEPRTFLWAAAVSVTYYVGRAVGRG